MRWVGGNTLTIEVELCACSWWWAGSGVWWEGLTLLCERAHTETSGVEALCQQTSCKAVKCRGSGSDKQEGWCGMLHRPNRKALLNH